jgi:hypothetical protein
VTEPRHDETEDGEPLAIVPALVGAQVQTARAEVFRAYVRARAKARALVADDEPDAAGPHRRAS